MEMDSLFFGESENAFYSFDELDNARKLITPIYSKTYYNLLNDSNFKYKAKKNGEIRILSVDIATQGGSRRDATCFAVLQLIPYGKNQFLRNLIYITTDEGGQMFNQAIKARRLFYDQDMLYSDYWTNSKRNVLSEINSRIFYMEFPQGKEPDTSALTQNQQRQQHEMVKNGILKRGNSGGTNFFSIASGTKINKLDVDTSLFKDECEKDLKNDICTDLGFAVSLLSGASSSYSSQQNNLQLVISEIYSWVESVSYELVKVINQNIIKNKKNPIDIYYLPCSSVNRKEFVSQMKELYTLGHGSLSAWIASTGISPEAYLSLMEMEKIEKWDEKFKPHLTSFTATSNDKGRPENTDSWGENTDKSKSNNSNNNPRTTN